MTERIILKRKDVGSVLSSSEKTNLIQTYLLFKIKIRFGLVINLDWNDTSTDDILS